MSAVNTDEGTILEALNNKSDRDLRNIDITAKADAVIDYQIPTVENNYTWYRKYKSGWVEQGGFQAGNSVYSAVSISLPVTMANTYYYANATIDWANSTWYTDSTMTVTAPAGTDINGNICDKTTSGFKIQGFSNHVWEVKGMAA